jgi:copper resistance protein C
MHPLRSLRAALLAFPVLVIALPAWAHAILVASAPEAGAVLAPGHTAISLRYNSRIDVARSRVTLQGPKTTQPAVLDLSTPGPAMLAATTDLEPGAYVLRWQVLAIDGHITRGDVRFNVAQP